MGLDCHVLREPEPWVTSAKPRGMTKFNGSCSMAALRSWRDLVASTTEPRMPRLFDRRRTMARDDRIRTDVEREDV